MRANDIEVHIAGPDGKAITEHHNTFLKPEAAYNGHLFSKLIDEKPMTNITIHIEFGDNFDLHGGDGVAVHISWKGCGQVFWIDKAQVGTAVSFDHVKEFTSSRVQRRRLAIPDRSTIANATTATMAWIDTVNQNSGCITVFIRYGTFSNRTGFMGNRGSHEPTIEQYENMGTPKIIRESWFTQRGEFLAFQFRNMRNEDIIRSYTLTPDLDPDTIMSILNAQSAPKTCTLQESPPKRPTKRARPETPKSTTTTSFKTDKAAKAKAAYLHDDDDQDDEEVAPPSTIYASDGTMIKQEQDAPAACHAPTKRQLPYRAGTSPSGLEHSTSSRSRTASGEADRTGLRTSSDGGADADEELLRLQLEENELRLERNRMQQQLRRKELMREGGR